MNIKLLALAGCTALALSVSAAYAVPSNEGPAAGKHVMHRHHVARYKAPNGRSRTCRRNPRRPPRLRRPIPTSSDMPARVPATTRIRSSASGLRPPAWPGPTVRATLASGASFRLCRAASARYLSALRRAPACSSVENALGTGPHFELRKHNARVSLNLCSACARGSSAAVPAIVSGDSIRAGRNGGPLSAVLPVGVSGRSARPGGARCRAPSPGPVRRPAVQCLLRQHRP